MMQVGKGPNAEHAETISALHLSRPAHAIDVMGLERAVFVLYNELRRIRVYRVQRDVGLNGNVGPNQCPAA